MPKTETASKNQMTLTVEKIYVDDLSLEIPHSPTIFLEQGEPAFEIQLRTESSTLPNHLYRCAVIGTVRASLEDKRTVFLVEASQSGIFQIRDATEESLKILLGITCPNLLYPYLREAISSTISRAGFPPVWLAPMNFEALYKEQQEKIKSTQKASETQPINQGDHSK